MKSQKGEEHNRKHEEAWEQRIYGGTKKSTRKRRRDRFDVIIKDTEVSAGVVGGVDMYLYV